MIPDFIHTFHCQSGVHCATCLVSTNWRVSVGAPSPCPWGIVTPEDIKARQSKSGTPVYTNQPGDILAKLIHTFTGETPCGACDARRKQMNEWSWTGCVVHIKEIAGWIEEEAQKRGKTLDPATVISTIWKAVKVGLKVEKEMLTKPIESSTDTNSETPSPAISQGAR
jgi:hypothetical protein